MDSALVRAEASTPITVRACTPIKTAKSEYRMMGSKG
jgi:hypothetical protein